VLSYPGYLHRIAENIESWQLLTGQGRHDGTGWPQAACPAWFCGSLAWSMSQRTLPSGQNDRVSHQEGIAAASPSTNKPSPAVGPTRPSGTGTPDTRSEPCAASTFHSETVVKGLPA